MQRHLLPLIAPHPRVSKGANELMLAVSELGGGWGFVCRLLDMK